MAEHPEVFISATTRDLGSYRREIKDSLLSLQIFPIEESTFTLAYGPLTEMLRDLIGRCDAVIHLVGFYYGAEPPQRPVGEPRRSYTQIEYDVARQLGKRIYLFLAKQDCQPDEILDQTDEEKSLQLAHRQAIQTCGEIYYLFASPQEVASRVRELRFPARDAKAPRRAVNLPYDSLGPLFKGRDAALAELRQRLKGGGGRAVGLTARRAIHGLGGVGKTRLAVEYAWRHASDYKNALLFVSARSPADFRSNLAALCNAEILNLPERDQAEEAARLAAVFRWLNEHSGWLLVLDNADMPEAAVEVEKTLPKLQGGDVIITSRIADWSAAVQTTELDVLGEQDAAAFLLERSELRRKKTATDTEDAAVLAHELGGLALALEQAGAYVAKNRLSFSEYRLRWESTREKVLAWYDPRLMQYPSSVATTWQTTFDQLTQPEHALLNILAWLAPEPIPVSLLDDVLVEGADTRDALSGLVSWSLARWTADGDAFTIHRLVQEITRQRLSENEKDSALQRGLEILNGKLPSPHWDERGWQLWERLAPHVRVLLTRLRDHALEPKARRMMNQLALWLYNRGKHGEAEPLFERELAISEKAPGPEHALVANSFNSLAALYHAQGRFAEVEPLYQRSLAIFERALGPEHPDVATSLNNLAELYRAQGRFAEAEPLYQRSLAILQKALGSEHPNLATILNNLALLYQAIGEYAKAEPLLLRAVAIQERALAPEHPSVATSLNNLADLCRAMGEYAKAEPLFKRALVIKEKALGPEHPDVAASLNSLAFSYFERGLYAEAEPLYQRALAIRKKVLGPEHTDVAISLDNLAALYVKQARYAEVELLYKQALAIFEHALGPNHPDLATSHNSLASFYYEQGRYAQAEPLYNRALAIWEKTLGPEHPNVATGLNNLAELLRATNRSAEAEPLYRRALAIKEESFGPEHPNVAISLNNLAGLLSATNRPAEAEPLYRRALAITEKSFGPEHSSVAISLNKLAGLLRATNRPAEAEPLYRRALAIDEKSFGPEHLNVATGLNNLAGLLSDTNRLAEAEPLYHRALAIDEASFGPEHPSVATGLNNLAELLRATSRLAEAEPLYRRALAITEKSFGPEHPKVATELNNLAVLLSATNRLAEAEPLFLQALRILTEFGHRTGHAHPHFHAAINNYAGLLSAMGLSEDEILARLRSAIESEPAESVRPSQICGKVLPK
jgi:tetratricopeptide (TPR) repeat protein